MKWPGYSTKVKIDCQGLEQLISILIQKGYQVLGPTVRENAIVYDEISSIADLPAGWTDEQDGGTYRLKRRNDNALFGYAVGPHSWKQFLHPPIQRLWQAERNGSGFHVIEEKKPDSRYAIFGARSCELHAIAIQDKVFLGRGVGDSPQQITGNAVDPNYKARREALFTVAINCGQAGGTCFCVSMKTGPKVTFGFDLALTEIIEPSEKLGTVPNVDTAPEGTVPNFPNFSAHYFIIEIGTQAGADVISQISHQKIGDQDERKCEEIVEKTTQQMGRRMDTEGIKELLYNNLEHPRWEEVANRCLTCSNCTMVCPTCFCATVEDVTDLTGQKTEHIQKWDSCFTTDFSYLHGGSIRGSPKSRYRQWMTHKLATWIDQFGTSGCVGCGRCVTWCPVGIDITEEVAAIRGEIALGTVPNTADSAQGDKDGKP